MGYFRFQKRLKIAPGIRLNLSKGPPSISVGGHGLTTNLSPRKGVTTTASIPGSGLSYRHTWHVDHHHHVHHNSGCLSTIGLLVVGCFALFGGLCSSKTPKTSKPSAPATQNTAASGTTTSVWTPERIERSGIFKPTTAPTEATPSPASHVIHKKRHHRAR